MEIKHTPEEHQNSLRKGLKVVVAVDLRSIDHRYFAKNLKKQIKSTNILLSHKSELPLKAAGVRTAA